MQFKSNGLCVSASQESREWNAPLRQFSIGLSNVDDEAKWLLFIWKAVKEDHVSWCFFCFIFLFHCFTTQIVAVPAHLVWCTYALRLFNLRAESSVGKLSQTHTVDKWVNGSFPHSSLFKTKERDFLTRRRP